MVRAPGYRVAMDWYARPEGEKHQLRVAPRLASWNKANDRDQVGMRAYLDDTKELLADSRVNGPWALRLDVGLRPDQDLLDKRDLDNYAHPLASRLKDDPGLVSVWCTKQYGEHSFGRIEAAREMPPPSDVLVATPTASYDRPGGAYKKQIQAALAGVTELPEGAVRIQLAFVVGFTMNWLNLWKPTIDALEPLLGRDPSANGPWCPRDGRITELGMHVTVDLTARYGVSIGIAAASA